MQNKIAAGAMSISMAALLFISNQEGFSPYPYKDIDGVWTNGYGNATINPKRKVDQQQALDDLHKNVNAIGDKMSDCIKVPISQDQYDAYLNLSYNIGYGAFCKSSIVKKLNNGDDVGSCEAIMKYTFVGGKDCKDKSNKCLGIVKRREYERDLCLKGLQ